MNNTIQITFSDEILDEITKAIKEAVKEELPKYKNSFRKDWLSTEEVMEMLNVSRRTVQNYRDEGKISYFQKGRKILHPREGIEDFLNDNMVHASDNN
jgi:excisionase family DNA binding protein